jgi:hypothetical protein
MQPALNHRKALNAGNKGMIFELCPVAMKNISVSILIIVAYCCAALVACTRDTATPAKEEENNLPPCNKDSVYYTKDVQPLLLLNCGSSGCHDAASRKGALNLGLYSDVQKTLVPGDAGKSMLPNIVSNTAHANAISPVVLAITDQQISLVSQWIQQGAKNNSCDACTVTNPTYSGIIQPLIANKCPTCHSPAVLSGGINLTDYAGVKAAAAAGKLYGALSWAPGFPLMPKGGAKLSECNLSLIKKWIDLGMQNN